MTLFPIISLVTTDKELPLADFFTISSPHGDEYAYLTINIRVKSVKLGAVMVGMIAGFLKLMGYY